MVTKQESHCCAADKLLRQSSTLEWVSHSIALQVAKLILFPGQQIIPERNRVSRPAKQRGTLSQSENVSGFTDL